MTFLSLLVPSLDLHLVRPLKIEPLGPTHLHRTFKMNPKAAVVAIREPETVIRAPHLMSLHTNLLGSSTVKPIEIAGMAANPIAPAAIPAEMAVAARTAKTEHQNDLRNTKLTDTRDPLIF